MASFIERFLALKTRVGGNREKTGFEYTFGMPKEEQMHVTLPAWHITRTLSQLDFAIKINTGAFDTQISEALDVLESGMAGDGVLTRDCCQRAEKALLPMRNEAKEYEILACGHAHIDMNWMWGFQETVAATLATFRTMLMLMREYPAFTYSQSQASVYRIVEEYAPDMMEEIKTRIREGRWEVTAAAWVETDKNMPDTESLLRHVRYTREYLRDTWDIDPDSLQVDFSPDTFGHAAHLPELNSYANVRYYYHCRGLKSDSVLYRWRAPSGREVLCYREPYWYNSGITPDIGTGLPALVSHMGGLKTGLIVYGVGDHGGGATRKDIERLLDMQTWPIFPAISFGTFRAFFQRAERVRKRLPVIDHELNALMTGCYTTQSRIKRGNRMSEASLLSSESLCAAASMAAGASYPGDRLTLAWRKVLFTHFHDILPGSCTQDSREYAMGLFQEAIATAQTEGERAARTLSDAIDTQMIPFDDDRLSQSEGAGAGYGVATLSGIPAAERGHGKVRAFHVFNSLPFARKELVEITVWDWAYDLPRLTVTDERGEPLPFQLVDTALQHYWDHKYFRVLVLCELPSLGYATVVLSERAPVEYTTFRLSDDRVERPMGDIVLENDRICAKFDGTTGRLVCLRDKRSEAERTFEADLSVVMTERSTSDAWHIGRHLSPAPEMQILRVEQMAGSLRQGLRVTSRVLSSTLTYTITLDANDTALRYDIEADWNESAREGQRSPVLAFITRLEQSADCFRYDVPGGAQDRGAQAMDQPGLTHAACVYGKEALALITDSKYGYRAGEYSLAATLINTAAFPDPYPERGIHHIRLWLAMCPSDAKSLRESALARTRPPVYVTATCHPGTLMPHGSLLSCQSRSAIISSVQIARDGAAIVRLYETHGKKSQVTLSLPFEPVRASLCDGDERETGDVEIAGNTVRFAVSAHALVSVKAWR